MRSAFASAVTMLVALAASVGCRRAPAEVAPPPASPPAMVVPAARLARASLFGTDVVGLPTGTTMTPDAAPGSVLFSLDPHVALAPELRASNAVNLALSEDGRTLLVLTTGYNLWFDREGKRVDPASSQWVFVYDLASGAPREIDVVAVPNTFFGIAFAGHTRSFFVSGGSDDLVREYAPVASGKYAEVLPAVALGHVGPKPGSGGLGIEEDPYAAGLALTPSGTHLVVANNENDSVSILDVASRRVVGEVPLRPGGGVAGGEFPFGLTVMDEHRAFVACQRDREIVEVDLDAGAVVRRLAVGTSPTTVTRNRRGNRLYVTNANRDTVSVVDVATGRVVSELVASALPSDVSATPLGARRLEGSNPNDAALSPDETTLYVTLGGNNAVAVLALSPGDRGDVNASGPPSHTVGLIPTGFYPHAVRPSADGRSLYIAFGKSPTGPNQGGPWSDPSRPTKSIGSPGVKNEFSLQLQHGGLHVLPLPDPTTLAKLTAQTLVDNRFLGPPREDPIFATLRSHVKHVVYVVFENRSYDQILGDLAGADGDPRLVHWPDRITPNQHALARTFVTLDRFFDSGGVSGDGWEWSMMGRSTDVAEKVIPMEYAGRGNHSYDWEGMSRNVNVAGATVAERIAANPATPDSPDLLPGRVAEGEVDEEDQAGRGLLWDAALAAGRTVRNYGCFLDLSRYGLKKEERGYLPPVTMPFAERMRVAFPTRPSLLAVTDPHYAGFDMGLADFWREREWERELDEQTERGDFPSLEIVRLPHDHLGSFASALDGVDTPDTQMADHDYALGRLVERLSKSPFWEETVVLALEDDAQNGSDHVDAHRSVAFLAGAYVRRHAVVSSVYATPSALRTIELLLGLAPLGQEDAFAPAMGDVFQSEPDLTPFTAIVPSVLHSTALPLPPDASVGNVDRPRGDRAAWARATEGFDFTRADAVPTTAFNQLLDCELLAGSGCARF